MKIGIGLPNSTPGASGDLLVKWARRAEERGFSTLATIDRIAYPSYESLVTLAAAGAATERIGLLTNIVLAPTRSTALLAKEAASVDQISGGRLTLGLAVGGRPDDFELTELEFHDRGKRFDRQLRDLRESLAGKPLPGFEGPVAPEPVREGGPPIVIGGMSDAAVRRTAEFGIGWSVGGGQLEHVLPVMQRVREAWAEAGRQGEPYFYALGYFGLGEEHVEASKHSILDYYAFVGDGVVGLAESVPRTPERIREHQQAFDEAGVDEFVWVPTVPDLDQVDLLADAVLEG
ncbi:MAG: LLM class flavin-dependent oxidoreductase [Actinomycetota bacterium]